MQADWRRRNPEYAAAYRIQQRSLKADEGGDPEPLRVPPPLDRLPWDVAKDQTRQDLVLAYKWFAVAGTGAAQEIRKMASEALERTGKLMTEQDISAAKHLATQWRGPQGEGLPASCALVALGSIRYFSADLLPLITEGTWATLGNRGVT
jgi:hypothetical protein